MKGFMSEDKILEISEKETSRIRNTEDREDARQEFCLGVLEAQGKAIEGKGVRAYQWTTARSKVKTFLHRSSEYSYKNRKSIDINAPIGGQSDGTTMIDLIPSKEQSPVAAFVDSSERQSVRDKVDALPKEMRIVINGRFFEGHTLETVGKGMGLTRERVRQIEKNALEHLKFQF